jgi:serine/threonine protein kinase
MPMNDLIEYVRERGLVTAEQAHEANAAIDAGVESGLRVNPAAFLASKGWIPRPQLTEAIEGVRRALLAKRGIELLDHIGTGAYGSVYRAHLRDESAAAGHGPDHIVAVKVMSPGMNRDPRQLDRFMNEALTLGRLRHENLVNAMSAGQAGDNYYLVMEYIDGPSLARLIRERGRLEVAEALKITLQVARALAYAHGENLIHRDVKPDNVLLTKDGVAKLCDLGLAKSASQDAVNLTMPGMTIGTPKYISPEQAMGESDLDGRVDLYALGIILYEMLAGVAPFTADSAVKLMQQQISEPMPDVRSARADVSEDVAAVIAKLTRKKRQDRYAAARLVIEDIEAIIAGQRPAHAGGAGPSTPLLPSARPGAAPSLTPPAMRRGSAPALTPPAIRITATAAGQPVAAARTPPAVKEETPKASEGESLFGSASPAPSARPPARRVPRTIRAKRTEGKDASAQEPIFPKWFWWVVISLLVAFVIVIVIAIW